MSGSSEGRRGGFAPGPMLEQSVECPYCGEEITIFVDPSQEMQSYVEDCTVCCRPIHVRVNCEDGDLVGIVASRE